MYDLFSKDTIAALSTPAGKGAIAIVRISGAESIAIINKIFSRNISKTEHQHALLGKLHATTDDRTIDQVIVTSFFAPHSFTGEDLVEISCHANSLIIEDVLSEIIKSGGRIARPGEFTQRAFINNKLDLAQAEAISQLIESKTRDSLRQSIRHLEGKLSEKINKIQESIIQIASLIEVSLDFTEEDIEIYDPATVAKKTEFVLQNINQLLKSFEYGHYLADGISLLLLGKPNAGKSSLLNALLEKERAIVSPIPGTTRDYIEGKMEISGIPVNIVDTAGIRNTDDPIEEEGVQRAIKQIDTADVVLALFDSSCKTSSDDQRLLDIYRSRKSGTPFMLLNTKCDLPRHPEAFNNKSFDNRTIQLSAVSGEGIEELKKSIHSELIPDKSIETEDIVVTSIRHKNALLKSKSNLESFKTHLLAGHDEAILASELRSSLDNIGEIVGTTSAEDLLNNIFGQFCIGK